MNTLLGEQEVAVRREMEAHEARNLKDAEETVDILSSLLCPQGWINHLF
jgi:hypothetical protein